MSRYAARGPRRNLMQPRKPRLFSVLSCSIALAIGGITACGGGGGAVDEFTKACVAATNMDETVCECTGKKAAAELSEGSFDLLVAMMAQDEDSVNRLRGALPLEETMAAGMFMTRGPAQCAEEMAAK
jgi:hypothetical protein